MNPIEFYVISSIFTRWNDKEV